MSELLKPPIDKKIQQSPPDRINFNFHAHSIYSDGKNTPYEMYQAAHLAGIDVFSVSDHNILPDDESNSLTAIELSLWNAHLLLIIPENTKKLNLLLDEYKIPKGSCAARLPINQRNKILCEVQKNNGLAIAAHPGYGYMSEMPRQVIRDFDMGLINGCEVHNHDVFKILTKNFKCLGRGVYKIWHEYVKKMFSSYMPTYAFSDAHSKEYVGETYSFVDLPVEYPKTIDGLFAYLKSTEPQIHHVAPNYEIKNQ